MSRRTAEASRAVREAWAKEQHLVLEGKGTRDWTPEQQQSIIDKGKAYDDDGRAFEGHHMKSAEAHPEFQGDAGNIQFLSRAEHKDAHGGSFRNPTNGFYNPISRVTRDFGDGAYVECEVIELSAPLQVRNPRETGLSNGDSSERTSAGFEVNYGNSDGSLAATDDVDSRSSLALERTRTPGLSAAIGDVDADGGMRQRVRVIVRSIVAFSDRHPYLTRFASVAGGAIVADFLRRLGMSDGASTAKMPPSPAASNAGFVNSESADSEDDASAYVADGPERNYPNERKSPAEHDVSGYERHVNGKTIKVKPYKRGGK